jgi:mono/diheme cytochrome c family protein
VSGRRVFEEREERLRKTRILAALVGGSIVASGVVAFAADKHPSDLFLQYCAKCHGEDGTASTARGKQLKARNFTDAEFQAGETDSDLIKSVTEGKDDMPPFGKKLTKEQIESLVKNDVRGFAKKS